jgi:hypothetical protein
MNAFFFGPYDWSWLGIENGELHWSCRKFVKISNLDASFRLKGNFGRPIPLDLGTHQQDIYLESCDLAGGTTTIRIG